MTPSKSTVISGGFGSFGNVGLVITSGFGTTADAYVPPVAPPSASGGGGGGGSTSRVDFDLKGRSRRFEDEPKRAVEKKARDTADAVLEKAREIAREKAALNALKEAQKREKLTQARLAKAAAMEAKVAEMEAQYAILRDDEEVLQIFLKVLED